MTKKLQRIIQDVAIWTVLLAFAEAAMLQMADLTHAHGRWVAATAGLAILATALKNFPDLTDPPEPPTVKA